MTEWMGQDRGAPAPTSDLHQAVVGYLDSLNRAVVRKLTGLDESRARQAPIANSPLMTPLGIVKHLTAAQRQHIQIHIGNSDLPSLFTFDGQDTDFRLNGTDTISSIVSAFDRESDRSSETIAAVNWDSEVQMYGEPASVGSLLTHMLQETARHLGHLDIIREQIDGVTGE